MFKAFTCLILFVQQSIQTPHLGLFLAQLRLWKDSIIYFGFRSDLILCKFLVQTWHWEDLICSLISKLVHLSVLLLGALVRVLVWQHQVYPYRLSQYSKRWHWYPGNSISNMVLILFSLLNPKPIALYFWNWLSPHWIQQ